MSASVNVVLVRDLDDKFAKMMAVKKACDAAGITYPDEVRAYFGGVLSYESEEAIRREMTEVSVYEDGKYASMGFAEGEVERADGMIIDLRKIPAEFKLLRIFYE